MQREYSGAFILTFIAFNCSVSFTSSEAKSEAYVCNSDQCNQILDPTIHYFPTITEAILNLTKDPSKTSPYNIFVLPGLYPQIVYLPGIEGQVEIYGYTDNSSITSFPSIGGFHTANKVSALQVRLESIHMSSFGLSIPCIDLQSTQYLKVSMKNVSSDCLIYIEGGNSSVIQIQNSKVSSELNVRLSESSSLELYHNDLMKLLADVSNSSTTEISKNLFRSEGKFSMSYSDLYANGNTFLQGFHLASTSSRLHLWQNSFMAFDEPVLFNQSLLANLILEIRCSVFFVITTNHFYNGTFQISDTSYEDDCPFQILPPSVLRKNIFPKPILQFRVYDLLESPAEPSVTITKGLHNAVHRTHEELEYIIDASGNYWGDPSGPYLCCNPNGYGAYASLNINSSDWCYDPLCNETSHKVFSSSCLVNGCQQTLKTSEVYIFYFSAGIAFVLLLTSIVFNVYHNIRHFNVHSFQTYSRDYLLPKAHVQWRIGTTASTIGACLALANVSVLLISTYHTSAHAHQHILPFRAFAITWMYASFATIQLVFNMGGLLASVFDWSFFPLFLRPLYFWNILNMIATIVVTLSWIPTAGFVDLLSHFSVTETSQLIKLLYISSAIICLISLTAFIPVRLMSELVHHYDNARISAVMEIALLKELMRSPDVEAKALKLRIMTVITLILTLLPAVATAYDIKIDAYFKTRLILTIVQLSIGIISLAVIFGVTFYYNQHLVLIIVSIALGLVSVGCGQDIIFWSYYYSVALSNSLYSKGYVIYQIAVFTVLFFGLLLEQFLVYNLDQSVLNELPSRALNNLNMHIDARMEHESKAGEKLPLLTSESDVDLPMRSLDEMQVESAPGPFLSRYSAP